MNENTTPWILARCVVPVAALVLMQSPAAAGTDDYRLLYGQATSTAKGTGDLVIDVLDPAYNTGYVYGGPALSTGGTIGVNAISDVSVAGMNFSLYAQVGELRNNLVSYSSTSLTPSPYDTSANAWGVSIARWGDSFTLSGAYGTTVRMRARIELDASGVVDPFSLNATPGGGPIGNALSYYVAMPVVGAKTYTCYDRNGSCSFSQEFEFDLISGTTHGLNADLTLSAYSAAVASYSENPLPLYSSTSFSSRGRVYLDVLTRGFSYTMSSGLQLTSPVPEPSMAASTLAGLLLLGGLARLRERRQFAVSAAA